jgi:CRISPR/Cas system-associated exonuclease Cas4 (RecB family)
MPNIPPIFTTTGPTEWASPPEWMSVHYLLAAERCPRSVALRYSRYAMIWKKQGYPEKPHVASLIGRIVHTSVERIASELAKKGYRSLSDLGAVQVLREMGGYSLVISRITEAALITLQDNPRLGRQREVLHAAVRTHAPLIREQVQVLLSRMTWEAMGTSQRAVTPKLGSFCSTRAALWPGLHFEAELRDATIKFRGIADSIEVGDSGCTITDFKTGEESENHEFQLRVYALLWQNDSELNPAGRPATKLTLSYPRADQNVAVPTESELADLSKELNSRCETVRKEIGMSLPKANLSNENCSRCEVRQLCEQYWTAARHKASAVPTLDASFDDIEIVLGAKRVETLWEAECSVSSVIRKGSRILVRVPTSETLAQQCFIGGQRVRLTDVLVSARDADELPLVNITAATELFFVLL